MNKRIPGALIFVACLTATASTSLQAETANLVVEMAPVAPDAHLGRYASDGGAMPETYRVQGLPNLWRTLVPCNLARVPIPNNARVEGSQVHLEYGQEPVVLLGQRRVLGFGNPFLYADNDGRGFSPADSPVDFQAEATRTRIREIRELMDELSAEGMEVAAKRRKALAQATRQLESGNPVAALEEAFQVGEQLVRDETAWRLKQKPGKETFHLGINMKPFANGGEPFREAVREAFDIATILVPWAILEPERGEEYYEEAIDPMVKWCRENGIRMHLHGLFWPSWWEKLNWQGELGNKEVLRLWVARARMLMKRYPNTFDTIELVNEPIQGVRGWFTPEETLQATIEIAAIIREFSPKSRLKVNFYNEEEVWYAVGWQAPYPLPEGGPIPVSEFIQRLLEAGVKIDLLGLQRHLPASLFDTRLAISLWQQRFGLPIVMSELIIPSDANPPSKQVDGRPTQAPNGIWRDQDWSEEVQAAWFAEFLPFFLAMPGVEGAFCWGASDAPNIWHDYLIGKRAERYRLPWMHGQGLLRADGSGKPAYDVVRRLREEWAKQTPNH